MKRVVARDQGPLLRGALGAAARARAAGDRVAHPLRHRGRQLPRAPRRRGGGRGRRDRARGGRPHRRHRADLARRGRGLRDRRDPDPRRGGRRGLQRDRRGGHRGGVRGRRAAMPASSPSAARRSARCTCAGCGPGGGCASSRGRTTSRRRAACTRGSRRAAAGASAVLKLRARAPVGSRAPCCTAATRSSRASGRSSTRRARVARERWCSSGSRGSARRRCSRRRARTPATT